MNAAPSKAILGFLGLLALHPVTVQAQCPTTLVAEGIRAYESLRLAEASELLRRAAATPPGAPPCQERLDALAYLGATEVFRDRSDGAAQAFRELVFLDPTYHPDPLTFPPAVTDLFTITREATPAAAIELPAVTVLRAGEGRLDFALHASVPHVVVVEILGPGMAPPVRILHRGPIEETLAITWDGLDESRRPIPAGSYRLRVASLDPAGNPVSTRIGSVDVQLVEAPPREVTTLVRERRIGRAFLSLGAGAIAGTGAALLPHVVEFSSDPARNRTAEYGGLAIGGTIFTIGVISFIDHLRGDLVPSITAAPAAPPSLRIRFGEMLPTPFPENPIATGSSP